MSIHIGVLSGNLIGKIFVRASILLGLISVASASSGFGPGLLALCSQAQTFLGISSMVLIVMAGAVYAIGQILGAETRARAVVWATSMLTGSVIGIVIYLIVPNILSSMAPGIIGSGPNPCSAASATPRGP